LTVCSKFPRQGKTSSTVRVFLPLEARAVLFAFPDSFLWLGVDRCRPVMPIMET
jgi:hypothetical protein